MVMPQPMKSRRIISGMKGEKVRKRSACAQKKPSCLKEGFFAQTKEGLGLSQSGGGFLFAAFGHAFGLIGAGGGGALLGGIRTGAMRVQRSTGLLVFRAVFNLAIALDTAAHKREGKMVLVGV